MKEQVIAVYEERYADDENYETIMRDVAEILEQMEHAEVRRLITEDKFVLMVVVLMKFVHWMLKLIIYQKFTVQVFSHVDKHKHYQF